MIDLKNNNKFFHHKRIVVYGASGGLGAAICTALCGKIAYLVLAGRNKEKLDILKERLKQLCDKNTRLEVWVVESSMAEFALNIQQNNIDGLIVATGKTFYQSFCPNGTKEESDPPDYEELLYVNFIGVLQLAMALLPYFRQRQGFFHITGSYACLFPIPYQAVYSASKTALLSLVQAVAKEQEAEFGRARVRGLFSISLIGGMATNMYYNSNLAQQFTPSIEKWLLSTPERIAYGLLKGIARKKTVITIGISGLSTYHLLRRLPSGWIILALLRAYRPKKNCPKNKKSDNLKSQF